MGGRAKGAAETPRIIVGKRTITLADVPFASRDAALREAFGISAAEARDAIAGGTVSIGVAVTGLLAAEAPPAPLGAIIAADWTAVQAQLVAVLTDPDASAESEAAGEGADDAG
jgi:hypothetical protein